MPFGETISNSYGTHSQGSSSSSSGSSPSHAPQNSTTPLRSRSNNHQSNLFSHPHSSFDEFPYPPYSELPFTSMKRRKQRDGNTFVKWAMRAVLASPVVVLVVWSIGAMLFSNKVIRSSNANSPKATNASRRRIPHSPPQMQQAQPLQQMQMPQFIQPYLMTPQQQQQQMMLQMPQLQQQISGFFGTLSPAAYMAGQTQQMQNMMAQQPGLLQAPSPVMPNFLGDAANPVVDVTPLTSTTTEQASPEVVATPEKEKRPPIPEKHRFFRKEEPLPASTSTGVLYYDPRQAVAASGDLILPPVVYDASGNPIDIGALQGKQVLMEAPVLGSTEGSPAAEVVETPKAQLSMPTAADIPSWGESTSQDQSIIVSTVAVMALLVGALSARRLRSRSLLSACIENESLEDDAAYDDAYTTSTIVGNHVSSHPEASYNTFGGGWKGDLEKFDV